MSILNYASNKFFDDNDYAYNAVANDNINPNIFPLVLDLIETPDCYVVIADIPGVSKDRVTVSAKEDKICIEGKRKRKVITNDDSYLVSERRNGPFKRMIQLPFDADSQDMKAKIEDGLLVLTIPRVKNVNGAKYISVL